MRVRAAYIKPRSIADRLDDPHMISTVEMLWAKKKSLHINTVLADKIGNGQCFHSRQHKGSTVPNLNLANYEDGFFIENP